MQSELTGIEIFNLLSSRYEEFLRSGAFTSFGSPADVYAHNAVIETLKDAVSSFSEGRLEVVYVK